EIEWGWASHRGLLPCPIGDGSHRKCTSPETDSTGWWAPLWASVGFPPGQQSRGTGGSPTGSVGPTVGTGGSPTRRATPVGLPPGARNPGGTPTGCAWDSHRVRTAPVGCPPGAVAPVGVPPGAHGPGGAPLGPMTTGIHLNSLVQKMHGHYLDLGTDQYVGDNPLLQKTFDLLAMPDEIVL
ncbi:hypothetical protein Taro_017948, partial [Colocasia esculenta]|nr:hypothetical protein [Colocasia esculenta]